MADLLPPPARDEVTDRGLVSRPWLRWLTDLSAAVVAAATSTALTAVETAYQAADAALSATVAALDATVTAALAALDVRVTALETDWADAVVDASYFASASGSWTVAIATDLIEYRYRRIGNTLQIAVRVNASSIGTTPTQLYLYLPNLPTIAQYTTGVFWYANFTSGDDAAGIWFANPGDTRLVLQRTAGGAAFANATDQFFLYLGAQCEVTG